MKEINKDFTWNDEYHRIAGEIEEGIKMLKSMGMEVYCEYYIDREVIKSPICDTKTVGEVLRDIELANLRKQH